jgi:hypothetical protein
MFYGQASWLARFFHAYCFIGNANIGLQGCAQSIDLSKLKNCHGDDMSHSDLQAIQSKTGVLCAH